MKTPAPGTSGKTKPAILLVTPWYLPGVNAGGVIKTIVNLTDALADEYAFSILTLDRDFGSSEPYALNSADWHLVGAAQVRYLSKRAASLLLLKQLLASLHYDVLMLHGMLTPLSLSILLLRRLGWLPDKPLLLAVHGELSNAAVRIKRYRKKAYFFVTRILGLYKGITWLATTDLEKRDIESNGPFRSNSGRIVLAADVSAPLPKVVSKHIKRPGHLNVVFLARISRIKNLSEVLQILAAVQGQVELDIFGRIEDRDYWNECQRLIANLGSTIQVRYQGFVAPGDVQSTLARYDLFFLPTGSENFGYGILEALAAGCPVLISDQTPWRDLQARRAGWALPLEDRSAFVCVLRTCLEMDHQTWKQLSSSARAYAEQYIQTNNAKAIDDNRKALAGLIAGSITPASNGVR